eukprot:SAG31_NODE_308_length_17951_cov_4.779240_7_plen_199_part_00
MAWRADRSAIDQGNTSPGRRTLDRTASPTELRAGIRDTRIYENFRVPNRSPKQGKAPIGSETRAEAVLPRLRGTAGEFGAAAAAAAAAAGAAPNPRGATGVICSAGRGDLAGPQSAFAAGLEGFTCINRLDLTVCAKPPTRVSRIALPAAAGVRRQRLPCLQLMILLNLVWPGLRSDLLFCFVFFVLFLKKYIPVNLA